MNNDNLVYKYVTAKRINVLKDARIRFTQPAALNDPFEFLPCMKRFEEKHLRRLQTHIEELGVPTDAQKAFLQHFVKANRVNLPFVLSHAFAMLCVSKVADNLLMWSHYASSHTGFVIGFDRRHPFFAPGNMSLHGLREVKYSRKRFVLPPEGFLGLSEPEMQLANEQFLFTKSEDWKYEQEMRLVAMPTRADKTVATEREPILLFNFPKDAVYEVILGARMQQKQRDEIAELMEEQYPRASLSQAVEHEDDYAVRSIPYPQFSKEHRFLSGIRLPQKVIVGGREFVEA